MNINIKFCENNNERIPIAKVCFDEEEINRFLISIANEKERINSIKYQRRHNIGYIQTTLNKKVENITIKEHLEQKIKDYTQNKYFVVSVGDVTANLLRPAHYGNRGFFFLADEPYRSLGMKNPYTAFIVSNEGSFDIDNIYFREENNKVIPVYHDNNLEIKNNNFLFCSVPLIMNKKIVPIYEVGFWNYDLRHIFSNNEEYKGIINKLYENWMKPGYKELVKDEINRNPTLPTTTKWFHSILGIKRKANSKKQIYFFHLYDSIPKIQEELKKEGVDMAVLLDSGGSSVMYGSWLKGGYISHQINYFREERGCVMIMEIK
jgi:hypothetical protein